MLNKTYSLRPHCVTCWSTYIYIYYKMIHGPYNVKIGQEVRGVDTYLHTFLNLGTKWRRAVSIMLWLDPNIHCAHPVLNWWQTETSPSTTEAPAPCSSNHYTDWAIQAHWLKYKEKCKHFDAEVTALQPTCIHDRICRRDTSGMGNGIPDMFHQGSRTSLFPVSQAHPFHHTGLFASSCCGFNSNISP